MSDVPPEVPPRKASAPIAIISIASIATAIGLGAIELSNPAIAAALPEALGTVPGWITSGGIMGILGLLIYWQLGNRKIAVDATVHEYGDKADIRDHYAEEVAALRARLDEAGRRNSVAQAAIEERYKTLLTVAETRYRTATAEIEEHYRRALADAEQRHDECVKDRNELRDQVSALKAEIDGLRRQFVQASAGRVLQLGETIPDQPSEVVVDSARRVQDIVEKKGGTDK